MSFLLSRAITLIIALGGGFLLALEYTQIIGIVFFLTYLKLDELAMKGD